MTDYLQVGVISSTHGVHGEVKVYPTTDDINRFKELKTLIMDPDGLNRLLHIHSVRFQKEMVLLAFDEFDSPEYAAQFKGRGLFVTRDQAVPLEEGEHYIADLIGMNVVLDSGEEFGRLTEVFETGANDVYVVQTKRKEVLLPAIKECILKADPETNTMIIHLMDGLAD